MQQYPAFSKFRELITKWENYLLKEAEKKDKQEKIKNLVDGQGYMLFFKKGDKIFGTPEEGRIVYASLKNPTDEDMPDGWEKDANFAAFDLISALMGNPIETLFSANDLPEIEVLDKANVEKLLMQCPNATDQPITQKEPIGIINLKDKKK